MILDGKKKIVWSLKQVKSDNWPDEAGAFFTSQSNVSFSTSLFF